MNEVIDRLEAYHKVLSVFSYIYSNPPEKDFIDAVFKQNLFRNWPFDNDDKLFKSGMKHINNFNNEWNSYSITKITQDYTNLFIGLETVLAPPYESVYLSKDHLMFDSQTLKVRRFYNKYELQSSKLNTEPDDHIGLELSFLSFLCNYAIAKKEAGKIDEAIKIVLDIECFLSNHLLRWLDQFCMRVYDNSKSNYYLGITYFMESTINNFSDDIELYSS